MSAPTTATLHPAVIETFLLVMRRKRPDLLWTVKSPPDKTDTLPDRRPLAA